MSHSLKKSWIVPSFDSFDVPPESSKKRSRFATTSQNRAKTNVKLAQEQLWAEKYCPRTQEELAVNKKKVEEVKRWLEVNLGHSRKPSGILLLTGPAGAGKTSTIQCLASELTFEVQEWTNKQGISFIFDDSVCSESQISTFHGFLKMAAKYSFNQIFGRETAKSKLILVEEFPTVFLKDVTEFHRTLRHYCHVGGCPLVFIITDSIKDNKIERHLFPKEIQHEMNITNISFNPVSATNLFRAVLRVANEEGLNLSKQIIDSLVATSHGDIRAALNGLQFTYAKDAKFVNTQSAFKSSLRVKRSKSKASEKSANDCTSNLFGTRDESLFLFHALGKTLHCKRDWDSPIPHRLHQSLKGMERHALLVDPEEMWNKTSVSANNFSAFLQENYVAFFSDIESIVKASQYLSEADCFNSEWMGGLILEPYILSVAARGLLHCSKEKSGVGWRPFHKPALFNIDKKFKENTDLGRQLFQEHYFHLTNEDLFSQLIPYMSKASTRNLNAGQNKFIKDIGRLSLGASVLRNQASLLDEKEVVEDISSDIQMNDNYPTSGKIENCNQVELCLNNEEITIEEYED